MFNNANQQAPKRENRTELEGGAATTEITPRSSQFLFGYPFVRRYSTGVHDPLLSSALYLSDGQTKVIFVANDIIFVGKASVARIRERVSRLTSVPSRNIMITATHTHSGPKTVDYLSNENDPLVPKTDTEYVLFMEEMIVSAATQAVRRARPVEVGLSRADGAGIGTNRRDPVGPADPEIPVLMVCSLPDLTYLACMVLYSMHPTVLHEDSTLISADFPGMTRKYLQREVLGPDCPVLYHTGPAGNQSLRHSVTGNTFPEAERVGRLLGEAIAKAISRIHYITPVNLFCCQEFVDPPPRSFAPVEQAQAALESAKARLKQLRAAGVPRQQIRTAEVDWFGAESALTLCRAAAGGRLNEAIESCVPAEIQMIRIGPWTFVGWQGEIFVEYALAVKARTKNTYLISLANGELQGYIATEEAASEGAYEAANALFAPASGIVFVKKTLEMLAVNLGHDRQCG
jgi:hypothetical protein